MDNSLYGNTKAMSTRACIYSSLWMYCSLCTAMFKHSSVLHQTLVHTNNGTTVRLWWTFSWLLYIWKLYRKDLLCKSRKYPHLPPLEGIFSEPLEFPIKLCIFLEFLFSQNLHPQEIQIPYVVGYGFFLERYILGHASFDF